MSDLHPVTATIPRSAPFVRDLVNLRGVFALWLAALLPCVLFGMWNTGYQANQLMASIILESAPGWRGVVLSLLGCNYQPGSFWSNLSHGAVYFLPVVAVAYLVGTCWENLFAVIRHKKNSEGVLLLSVLFALTLPPNIPLWQVTVGMSFAVVIAKEVFGGTGMNIVHPVLAGRAFLYFAYPDQLTGDTIWTAVDSMVGATPLALAKSGGMDSLLSADIYPWQAFLGVIPGSIGETSTLLVFLGGLFLLFNRLISWRIIVGGLAGLMVTSLILNYIGNDNNAMFALTWSWHVILGGFAFGLIFLATDPVTSSQTDAGKWVYGLIIGILVVLIRVANPAIPEGMMFAILLANILAPTIDQGVVKWNVRKRRLRQTGLQRNDN